VTRRDAIELVESRMAALRFEVANKELRSVGRRLVKGSSEVASREKEGSRGKWMVSGG
jgi:hypothetical protein